MNYKVNLHEIPPRKRLLYLREKLKRVRSLKSLRSRVCEYLECGGKEVKEFHYKLDGHDWKGIIYLKRNNLMGSIFSLFDNKVVIIRGFPKIRYSRSARMIDKYVITEEKVDGTNIGVWAFHNDSIMGKTRMVQRWDLGSQRAGTSGSWKVKFESAKGYERVYDLAREGYLVFCELYGYKNSGEFVKYTVPIAFKVIGIVDRTRFNFLPRAKVEMLCDKHMLPLVEVYWEGLLSKKEVERLEFELDSLTILDGMEGLVAKCWDTDQLDSRFCKLKCEKIKESCYKLSHSLIPATLIRKAIKKAIDEQPGETKMTLLLPEVFNELKEEFDESILDASMSKIKGLLRYATTPSDEVLRERVIEGMKELKVLGVDITNPKKKGEVLSGLHDILGDIRGTTLYKLYLEVLLEMEGKW